MGDGHRVDVARRPRQGRPVELAQVLQALEQAAIDKDTVLAETEEMLGAGDGPGTAERFQ